MPSMDHNPHLQPLGGQVDVSNSHGQDLHSCAGALQETSLEGAVLLHAQSSGSGCMGHLTLAAGR